MANIVVSDLVVSKELDSIQMAAVSGGLYMTPKYPNPNDPMNEPLSNGIVIIGEDKYGGWGGQW
jgi:hypothetical protein